VNRSHHLPAAADPRQPFPLSPGRRFDHAQAALLTLREEERRLARLGLDEPLRHCREQLRYWQFLAALFSLQAMPRGRSRRPARSDG
jgi:hypothetical protein